MFTPGEVMEYRPEVPEHVKNLKLRRQKIQLEAPHLEEEIYIILLQGTVTLHLRTRWLMTEQV